VTLPTLTFFFCLYGIVMQMFQSVAAIDIYIYICNIFIIFAFHILCGTCHHDPDASLCIYVMDFLLCNLQFVFILYSIHHKLERWNVLLEQGDSTFIMRGMKCYKIGYFGIWVQNLVIVKQGWIWFSHWGSCFVVT
jgi:hypothetical protein